ncbi:MAG: PIN domain-containing protein [Patescibacteria group bacterium]
MNGHNGPGAYLIDSNIFLRVIVRDEEHTWKDCVDILFEIEHDTIVAFIPTVVIAEVQYVLKSFYGFEKSTLIKALAGIVATRNLEVVDDLSFPLAMKLFEDHNVKFVDSLIASSRRVQEKKAAILSYDRDFDKLGIKRVEPRDFLKKSLKK